MDRPPDARDSVPLNYDLSYCEVVTPLPVGTNLALLHPLWMLLSGNLLGTRGAIIPGLSALGLSIVAVRRAWAAVGKGGWRVERLCGEGGSNSASDGFGLLGSTPPAHTRAAAAGARPLPIASQPSSHADLRSLSPVGSRSAQDIQELIAGRPQRIIGYRHAVEQVEPLVGPVGRVLRLEQVARAV